MLADLFETLRTTPEKLIDRHHEGDEALMSLVRQAAAERDMSPREYLAMAVDNFVDSTSESDWLPIAQRLHQQEDPERSCMHDIVRGQIERDRA